MTIERSTRARFTAAIVLVMVLGAGVVLGMAINRTLGQRGAAGEVARSPGNRSGPDSRGRGGFEPRSNRMPPPPGDSTQRRPPLIVEQVGLSEARITSYNVCYTKLLRSPPRIIISLSRPVIL